MFRTKLLPIFLILTTGCAGTGSPAGQPVAAAVPLTAPVVQSDEMKKPFMFGEAKLPNQFPPPGPVGEILIKKYPIARAAVVRAGAVRDDQDDLFMPLFRHIQSHQIAMSAPVEMTYATTEPADQPSAMAFFYGDTTIGQTGKDGSIDVIDVPS